MKRNKKLIIGSAYVFFLALILIGIVQLANYKRQAVKAEKLVQSLADQVISWEQSEDESVAGMEAYTNDNTLKDDDINPVEENVVIPESINFDELKQQNDEIVAWIYCPGTVINYPIVHTGDNDKYLHKDILLRDNRAGTLFIDAENQGDFSDWNTIIYGHNMKNGSMFKTITEYTDQSFLDAHACMYLYTPGSRYKIHILGGSIVNDDASIYTCLSYTDENANVIRDILNSSIKQSEKIVTFSTCSYEYEDARYVLFGMVETW